MSDFRELLELQVNETKRVAAERDRYREALERIATKEWYGCCQPIYPDSPVCAHNIARQALSPNPSETGADDVRL